MRDRPLENRDVEPPLGFAAIKADRDIKVVRILKAGNRQP